MLMVYSIGNWVMMLIIYCAGNLVSMFKLYFAGNLALVLMAYCAGSLRDVWLVLFLAVSAIQRFVLIISLNFLSLQTCQVVFCGIFIYLPSSKA